MKRTSHKCSFSRFWTSHFTRGALTLCVLVFAASGLSAQTRRTGDKEVEAEASKRALSMFYDIFDVDEAQLRGSGKALEAGAMSMDCALRGGRVVCTSTTPTSSAVVCRGSTINVGTAMLFQMYLDGKSLPATIEGTCTRHRVVWEATLRGASSRDRNRLTQYDQQTGKVVYQKKGSK